ncbi:TetR/AcrR family transcriptional regulator [Mycolicibacterium hippocampi]|uniref:TetR/AcrR family transcriptional regulator n=1 Tax=Mycolicibacterium hippocampi TaxID=659824 RepID=UPI00351770E3
MSTRSVHLPEQHSATAARVLTAANDLLLGRGAKGFTVADVATRAHVGKGTVYLYWPTKEDLLIGLVGRGFLRILDDLIVQFDEDPALARPSRFCPTMVQTAAGQPLIAALQRHDDDLLGVLAEHPRSVALNEALGPGAVLDAVLPLWRRDGLARNDWDQADQAFALRALITGVTLAIVGEPVTADHRLQVLGNAVTALLGPERTNQKKLRAAATGIVAFLRDGRAAALRLINADGAE